MFDLFLDIFAYRDQPLVRMDPRVKLLAALMVLLSILFSHRPVWPLLVFAGALLGLMLLRIPWRLVLFRLAAPMGVVLVLILLQSLTVGSTPMGRVSLYGRSILFWKEGFGQGTLIGSRVLGAVSLMLLVSSVTPAYQLIHALRWLGLPKSWVEVAVIMYRYIFALLDRAADILAAQKVRLGYSGVRRSLNSLGALAGSVIILSLDQASRTHEAMVLRGYRGTMPFGPLPAMAKKDRWLLVLTAAVILSAYFLFEWSPWR